MIKIDVPNLDAVNTERDADELVEFAKNIDRLSAYATSKASAVRNRLHGKIVEAQKFERQCEHVYNLLPPSWRW